MRSRFTCTNASGKLENRLQMRVVDPAAADGVRAAEALAKEVACFREHQHRMDYLAAQRAGEPIGNGPVEAACRFGQYRFKRPGKFWSTYEPARGRRDRKTISAKRICCAAPFVYFTAKSAI